KETYTAGFDIQLFIRLLEEFPAAAAAPAVLDVFKHNLNHREKLALAQVCVKLPDPRFVSPLSGMLDPRHSDLRWQAVEALRKINTDEAAKALLPHLRGEADLLRKLQIAEFLGRHGIRDGYVYALEHLSEPHLLEQAVTTLA